MGKMNIPPGVNKNNSYLYFHGALFAALFICYSLFSIFTTPQVFSSFTHVGLFQLVRTTAGWRASSLLFLAMFIAYGSFFYHIQRLIPSARKFWIVVISSLIFCCILLVALPFLSADLYGYIYRAMATNTLHVNPYTITPAATVYSHLTPWSSSLTPYGPLYTIISLGEQKISGSSLVVNLVIFRVVNLVIFFLSAWILFSILSRINKPFAFAGTSLFLWNPFLLIEIINNGHNDILMILFILLGIKYLIEDKIYLSTIALTFGFLIKYFTIFLVPFSLLAVYSKINSGWKKIQKTIIMILLFVIISSIFYLPFGSGLQQVTRLYDVSGRTTFLKGVISFAVGYLKQAAGGTPLSGGEQHLANLIFYGLGLAVAYYIFWKRGLKDAPKQYFWVVFLVIYLISMSLNPWYTTWLFPLAILIGDKRYRPLIIFLTAQGLLFYVVSRNEATTFFCVALIFYLLTRWFLKMARKQVEPFPF